jgi:prenyltransferase beta subunit
MAIDLKRARSFVETHGNAIDRARIAALFDNQEFDRVPSELQELQNEDGGFPVGMVAGRLSGLSPTCMALTWLRDLDLLNSDEAQRAIQFVVDRQTPRGIWRESPALQQYTPPPWMDPESPAADVYTTALCASTIITTSDDELPADLAVEWLQTQQARDGLLIGFRAHSSWLAVPAFAAIYGPETRSTRRLIAGLGAIFAPDWSAGMTAWMLQSLLDARYTRRTELVDRAWQQLRVVQQPDGSFGADEGDEPVQSTLQAIDVAQRMGVRS